MNYAGESGAGVIAFDGWESGYGIGLLLSAGYCGEKNSLKTAKT